MSTRTRTRAAASSTPVLSARTRGKQTEETPMKLKVQTTADVLMNVDTQKVNLTSPTSTTTKPASKNGSTTKITRRGRKKASKANTSLKPVDCVCTRGDDGSPMILCAECRIWYHFTCVDLAEPEAEDIRVFICTSCSDATGRRTTRDWEGDEAFEESPEDLAMVLERRKVALKAAKDRNGGDLSTGHGGDIHAALKFDEESDGSNGSEDEYVEEEKDNPRRSGAKRLSRLRRASTATVDSEDDVSEPAAKRSRFRRAKPSSSPSPAPSHNLKRKATTTSVGRGNSPPPKRKKSVSHSGGGVDSDPARKYCLGKMEDIFKSVFLKYPHIRVTKDEEGAESMEVDLKNPEELTEEEKEQALADAQEFARELESCVFEIYAEPDKHNFPHAGPKYKDRFRTLQFNLSKPDRVVLHQRITAGTLSAKEISSMSSTDLADEETKQSIKLAEKEALAHSILQKQTAPRAKITHKGLQDIEDVRGDAASSRESELQKELDKQEEERRERERVARLKSAQRQRTASLSVPPESPVTPTQTPSSALLEAGQHPGQEAWGAPPPVPLHAMTPTSSDEMQRPPLFIHSSSDFLNPNVQLSTEPELTLNDLISIDDDQDGVQFGSSGDASMIAQDAQQPVVGPNYVASPTEDTMTMSPTTGVSPFAERGRTASFDLNALWSQPTDDIQKEEPLATDAKEEVAPVQPSTQAPRSDSDKDDNMDIESDEANDQDFDMFLGEEPAPAEPEIVTPPVPQTIEELGQVWTGKISMPLDSTIPQETTLLARQIGGKALSNDSPLWQVLFPTDTLRVEGRVPVENSVKYLLQMRMNPTKELYAVALAPAKPENEADFKILNSFLIQKSRHGLVFPWGSRPKDHHPGRELYMVPLLQTEALPEFVELLIDLKMPKIRSRDYMLGVWIINKGKLVPATQPITTSMPITGPASIPHAIPSQPTLPAPFGATPPIPPSATSLAALAAIPGLPNPSALAAEVASLTPDQIQSVLRTLASQAVPSIPPTNGPPLVPGPVPPPPQSWPPAGGPPASYPPFAQSPGRYPPAPAAAPLSYERPEPGRDGPVIYERPVENDSGYDGGNRGGGDRGWRGQGGRGGRGGGRGRGRGRGGQEYQDRQRDSGWPRKARNEGYGTPGW